MRDTIASKRARHSPAANAITNMARRAVASLIRRVDRGQFSAHEGEVFDDVPIYQMAGFASFPAAGQFVKAVLVALGGGARNYVAVASSTKAGRPDMVAGETAIWNSIRKAVKLTAVGEVLLGEPDLALDQVVKGTTYRAAEDGMLTALQTALAAQAAVFTDLATTIFGPTGLLPSASTVTLCTAAATATTTAATAISTFQAGAASYLSTVTKTE